jgi:DNA-binding MarR family transcriptional regulator
MSDDALARFRRAYWQVFRDLDAVRLRLWEQSGLTLPQLRVLFQVRRAPGITTKELSRALGVTVSTTSGLAIKLVERGLIERLPAAADRRLAPLRLTPAGEDLTGELAEPAQRFLAEVAGRLGDDLAPVTAALERLAGAAAAVRAPGARPAAEPGAAGEAAQ